MIQNQTRNSPEVPPRVRQITRRWHGVYDYVFGIVLATSPWAFGFTGEQVARDIAVTLGIIVIFYSIVTNYEMGVVRFLPFAGHCLFDIAIGIILLAAVPWHLAATIRTGLVLSLLGLIHLVVTAFTQHPKGPSTIT